jgi:arsenate reductase-like glutaredoxin family protein
LTVTIYHNPACGTSRNALAMIRQSGEEPEVQGRRRGRRVRETLKGARLSLVTIARHNGVWNSRPVYA